MATLYSTTNKIFESPGNTGYSGAKIIGGALANTAQSNAKGIWYSAGNTGYTMKYSTINYSRSSSSVSATGAGQSSSGRTYTAASAFGVAVTGTWSGTGHWGWQYISGDNAIAVETIGDPASRFYRDISGVANGTTSSTFTAVWRLWVYDDVTGASAYDDFTINVAWQNQIPAYSPFDQWIRGAQNNFVTIPVGAPSVTIYVVGGGGGGGFAIFNTNAGIYHPGGGNGGNGGVNVGTYSTAGQGGNNISFTIGAGGPTGSGTGGTTSITGGVGAGLAATGGSVGAFGGGGVTAPGGSPPNGLIDPPWGQGGAGGADGSADPFGPFNGNDGEILFRWN